MKKAARAVKNVTKGYSEAQVKVRKATSNEAWGPEGADMAEIAQMTFDSHDFLDVMDMLDRRMNDRGKMWRHVYKALQVFDYCVHSGSENVVRWGKDNLYVIKSLREFQHIDDEGVDQGANIRSKAKDLTALLQDDERLRQERANRSNMQTRINGQQRRNTISSPVDSGRNSQRRRNARRDDDDDEMNRAIEASKKQADEDEKKRRAATGETDDDIAKAIKLSKEEEELRQSRAQQQNENSLFDDAWDQPVQPPQPLYQQSQQQVDFWGNPIDMSPQQQQQQSTGYLQNVYSQPTGFLPQQTGYMQPQQTSNGFSDGFNKSNNPYVQTQPQFTQLTGYQQPSSPVQSTMSNNPYAQQQPQQSEALQPMPTGSNNPFAQFGTSFNQQPSRQSFSPTLNTLSEQQQQQPQFQTSLSPQNTSYSQPQPQKPQSEHQNKLDYLLAQGNPTGQDTFGNTGEVRVPAHFNRTGYVNSAGQGLRPSVTGVPGQANNPFFTGQGTQGGGAGNVRPLTQSTTGPAYQPTQYGQYGQQNQQGQTGSLIDF